MICISEKKRCCGCAACQQVCPKKCITMAADEEGFWYPEVDTNKCIQCGACERVCPLLHNKEDKKGKLPNAYAAMNTDQEVREKSSSGGIFTLLAQAVISKKGVVFGAVMDPDQYGAHHMMAEDEEGLESFRGSKYIQSDIRETYIAAKKMLDCNKLVLFSGTPCQISGLKSFLGKDYPNLLSVDLICHGVPSPLVWKKYLSEIETSERQKAVNVIFRKKVPSWQKYSMSIQFANKVEKQQENSDNPYMQAFLQNACLRPACYDCHFKSIHHDSDITLGDCWGIQKTYPEMDDGKGTSFIIIHTEKGQEMHDAICNRLQEVKIDIEDAVKNNLALVKSASIHPKRNDFFSHIEGMDFNDLVYKYITSKDKILRIVIRLVHKLIHCCGLECYLNKIRM